MLKRTRRPDDNVYMPIIVDFPTRIAIVAKAAVPAPASSASAAAPGSCSVPDSEARIDRLVLPTYTEAMKQRHKAGVVDVAVYLQPNGSIEKALVTHSSGDALLDAATYAAAMQTTYTPEVRGCTYLAGSYDFRARYRAYPSSGPASTPTGPPAFAPLPEKTFGPVPYASDAALASPVPASSPKPH